jgi:hypothetical protein
MHAMSLGYFPRWDERRIGNTCRAFSPSTQTNLKIPKDNKMKSLNTLVLASVIALTGAGIASATPQVIHVTGSTAYRVADVTAEVDYLNTNDSGTTAAYNGSSLTGANSSIIVSNDGNYVIENSFNGSIAGDEAVAAVGNKLGFPSYSAYVGASGSFAAAVSGNSTTAASGGIAASPAFSNTDTVYADIAFSDVSANTADQIISLVPGVGTYSYTDDGVLGVVPFVFIANATTDVTDFGSTTISTNTLVTPNVKYATATIGAANMTPQAFARLWSAGSITTAARHPEIFTGNASDSVYKIYALGRDPDSGTRATALCETGYALAGNGAAAVTNGVIQNYPYDSTGTANIIGNVSNAPIAAFEVVPASNIDGIPLGAGDGGYSSGGKLAEALSDTFSGSLSHNVAIGYLGTSDAYAALTNTAGATTGQAALLLPYNGVSFNPAGSSTTKNYAVATDLAKIYYGSYTFWGYEHLFFANNNSFDPTTFAGALKSQLLTDGVDQISAAGVTLGSMVVSRTDDGLVIH